jgi:hypothetical protein
MYIVFIQQRRCVARSHLVCRWLILTFLILHRFFHGDKSEGEEEETEAKCVSYAPRLAVIDALMPMAFAKLM